MALTENFTGTDGADISGRTLSGGGATWVQHATYSTTPIKIKTNQVEILVPGGVGIYYTSSAQAVGQYAQGVITAKSSGAGSGAAAVCCRVATGADTRYEGQYYAGNGKWEIYEVVAGSATALGTSYTPSGADIPATGVSVTARLEITDSRKELFVNGVSRVVDTTHNNITAAGRQGIKFYDGIASTCFYIDNYEQGDMAVAPNPPAVRRVQVAVARAAVR